MPATSMAGWVRSVSLRSSSGPSLHNVPQVVAQHRRGFVEGGAHHAANRRRASRACRPTGIPGREIRKRVSCLTWARSITDCVTAARGASSAAAPATTPPMAPYRCASTMVLARTREWQRARELFVAKFRHDEHRENPAVEIAAPQMRDACRPSSRRAARRTRRRTTASSGFAEPQARAHRERGTANR